MHSSREILLLGEGALKNTAPKKDAFKNSAKIYRGSIKQRLWWTWRIPSLRKMLSIIFLWYTGGVLKQLFLNKFWATYIWIIHETRRVEGTHGSSPILVVFYPSDTDRSLDDLILSKDLQYDALFMKIFYFQIFKSFNLISRLQSTIKLLAANFLARCIHLFTILFWLYNQRWGSGTISTWSIIFCERQFFSHPLLLSKMNPVPLIFIFHTP